MRFPIPDTDWSWRTEDPIRVGVACVQVGDHARYWVDSATPERVVAFQADNLDGIAALATTFGHHWMTHAVDSHGPYVTSNNPDLQPPDLSPAQARQVVVAAVTQWSPLPLDDRLLLIDEALALDAAGHRSDAAQLLELVEPTLMDLVHDASQGWLPEATHPMIRRASQLLHWTGASESGHDELASLLDDPSWPTPGAAESRATGSELTIRPPGSVPVIIDPRYLHPRLLAWTPQSEFAVAAMAGDPLVVIADLMDDALDDSREVRSLRASVVDLATGTVADTVPFSVDDNGTLTAQVRVPTSTIPDVAVWVYCDELSPVFHPKRAAVDRAHEESHLLRQFAIDRAVAAADAVTTHPSRSGPVDAPLLAELLTADAAGEANDFPVLAADLDHLDLIQWQWEGVLDIQAAFRRDADTTAAQSANHEDARCTSGEVSIPGLAEYGYHPRVTWRYCHDKPALTVFVAATDDTATQELPRLEASFGSDWTPLAEDEEGNFTAGLNNGPPGILHLRITQHP